MVCGLCSQSTGRNLARKNSAINVADIVNADTNTQDADVVAAIKARHLGSLSVPKDSQDEAIAHRSIAILARKKMLVPSVAIVRSNGCSNRYGCLSSCVLVFDSFLFDVVRWTG